MGESEIRFPASAGMVVRTGLDAGGLYSPPLNRAHYEHKPLPPLPLYRRSVISSFRSEVTHAFSPTSAAVLDDKPFLFDWEREERGRSVNLHQGFKPLETSLLSAKQRKRTTTAFETLRRTERGQPVSEHAATPNPAALNQEDAATSALAVPRPAPAYRQTYPSTSATRSIAIPTVPPDEILSPQPRSSVQKILRLTGNMSPATSLSTDTPSLHNSSSKIRQLTGLDVDFGMPSQGQAPLSEAKYPIGSSETSSSMHGGSYQNSMSYDPAESEYSLSYVESINQVRTPIGGPRSAPSFSPMYPTFPIMEFLQDYQAPAPALSQLSDSVADEPRIPTPDGTAPAEDLTLIAMGRRESWYHDHSDSGSMSPSSSDMSDSELDLEPTAAELYHDTAASIAKSSPRMRAGLSPPFSPRGIRRSGYRPDNTPSPRRTNRGSGGSIPASPGHARAASRPFSLNPFRRRDGGAPSERRGRHSSPLDAATYVSPSPSWKLPHRPPHPPAAPRASEEMEDGAARATTLLAKIFTGASATASTAASMARRESAASTSTAGRAASVTSQTTATTEQAPATSEWSPDTPTARTGMFSENGSARLLSRTFDHAMQRTGRKNKTDKAEKKGDSPRGKAKVLR